MSLRINKDNLFFILPEDRYSVSQRIDKHMAKDFTLYVKVKVNIEELQANKDVVFAAVHNHERALEFASDKLKKDKKFLIKCYRKNNDIRKYNDFIEEFDKLEKQEYDNVIIKKNIDILHLVKNKKQLCKYLLDNEQYDIIYQNEGLSEYIKDNYKIIILSFDIINPIYNIEGETEEEIKNKYREDFLKIYPESTLIFIE